MSCRDFKGHLLSFLHGTNNSLEGVGMCHLNQQNNTGGLTRSWVTLRIDMMWLWSNASLSPPTTSVAAIILKNKARKIQSWLSHHLTVLY